MQGKRQKSELILICFPSAFPFSSASLRSSRPPQTARSRGFGFVTMSTVEEATECIERLNGLELNGRRMRVDYSTTHRPHDPTPGAYMGEKRPQCECPRGGFRGGGVTSCMC